MDRAEALEAVGLTIMSRARVREQRGSPTTWEHRLAANAGRAGRGPGRADAAEGVAPAQGLWR